MTGSRDYWDLDFRVVFEAGPSSCLITDPNQPDNPIIFASRGFQRLTGYRAEEVLGRNCRFLHGKQTDPETVAALRAAICAGRECSAEILNYRKDGTTFWNALFVTPIRDERGKLLYFVGVQTDVTERRTLEQAFRQSQRVAAVGQFVGGVVHDFNNLLTIILGSCDLLRSDELLTDFARSTIGDIREAARRATSLTRQLLAFSRKQAMTPLVLDLNEILKDLNKMLMRLIGENIELSYNLFPAIWPVRLDPGQIEQVVVNLAVNARDAMPSVGKLSIETANVEWSAEDCRGFAERKPGRYVRLVVADSGSGMPPEVQARMFEPFFTTKEAGKGTGLGLAIVQSIVKQSGGYIDVVSAVGGGTSFAIYLPAVEDQVTREALDKDRPSRTAGAETILLVEDEEGIRRLARRALEKQGYAVLEAGDGQEALCVAQAHAGPLHLVVTDVVMPAMGGRQLVERLLVRFPAMKVLYMSGYGGDAVAEQGIDHPSQAILQKPFSSLDLLLKVRQLLDA